jgi:transcriptional regulator GlxA family with amidase domain
MPFAPQFEHGDAAVTALQEWLRDEPVGASTVEDLFRRSGMPRSTFNRRFRAATGYSPLEYVQRLRIEEARRLLECTDASVDEICWRVGYEEPAAFRRLFKRITSLTPSEYRRKFRVPTARIAAPA